MAAAGSLSLRRYDASHGSHAHAHFQVLIGLEGVLELEVDGRGRRIAAGEGFVIAPGERHDFSAVGSCQCLVLDSTMQAWQHHAERPSPQASELARCLAHSVAQHHPFATFYGPLLLLEAWGGVPVARGPRRAIDWAALADWASARADTALDVAALAARACLSPGQFNARCREETGASAMQWLRALRLTQARALRATGISVAESARRAGYRSPSALTAALRRQGGGTD